jgi:ketosteroid isomerase-like protein
VLRPSKPWGCGSSRWGRRTWRSSGQCFDAGAGTPIVAPSLGCAQLACALNSEALSGYLREMSQEHIERLREGYELMSRKDFDAALARVPPDFVFETDPAGPIPPNAYRGRAEVKGFWQDFFDSFDDVRHDPYEFREAAGGKILVRVHLSAYLNGSGEPLRLDYTHLWTIRDDEAVHVLNYFDHVKALEAAGLRESGDGRTPPLTRRGRGRLPRSVAEHARRARRRWSGLARRSPRHR